MYDGNEVYVESVARTDKLHCSDCGKKIKKGDTVVFKLEDHKMLDVYGPCGPCCAKNYEQEVASDTQHPHDLDG